MMNEFYLLLDNFKALCKIINFEFSGDNLATKPIRKLKHNESIDTVGQLQIKDKLYDGRTVNYCVSCWKALQKGLKIYKL